MPQSKALTYLVVGVIAAVLSYLFIPAVNVWVDGKIGKAPVAPPAPIVPPGAPAGSATTCPTAGTSTVTLNIQNTLNTTGIETYDAEVTFIGAKGGKVEGTDGTAGSYATLNCGEEYTLVVESADGASGDNSKITKILEGQGAVLNSDGSVTFTPMQAGYYLTVGVPQHGTLEFRLYDNKLAAFAYDTSDATNTGYETDGVTYRTGDNATAFAISNAGDELDFCVDARTAELDTEFTDNGGLVALELPVTEFDAPTGVRYEAGGVSTPLNDIKAIAGSLNGNELKQFSNYEYVYAIDKVIARDGGKFCLQLRANADASTDIQIDFAARGKVDSVKTPDILISSAQDDSSATTVYAIQDITVDIS